MEKLHKLASPLVLSEVIGIHRAKINQIKAVLKDYLSTSTEDIKAAAEQAPVDEIFIVRYILSNPGDDVRTLVRKIQSTLEWRASLLELLIEAGEDRCQKLAFLQSYLCKGYLGEYGGNVFYAERHGHNDLPRLGELIKYYSEDGCGLELADAFLLLSESSFRKVDAMSRRTDRLCKIVAMFFLENVSMKLNHNIMKVIQVYGTVSKRNTLYYPQLLGVGVVFSSESMLQRIFLKVCKAIMSEKTWNKIIVCKGYKKGIEPSSCPGLKLLDSKLDWTQVFPKCANGAQPNPPELKSRQKPEA